MKLITVCGCHRQCGDFLNYFIGQGLALIELYKSYTNSYTIVKLTVEASVN